MHADFGQTKFSWYRPEEEVMTPDHRPGSGEDLWAPNQRVCVCVCMRSYLQVYLCVFVLSVYRRKELLPLLFDVSRDDQAEVVLQHDSE